MPYLRSLLALCLTILFANSATAESSNPDDWLQWRGPSRDGHAIGESWPDSLDPAHLKLAWRVELGPSYSGPIVAGDLVFTTETRDKQSEAAFAYHRCTGEPVWVEQWQGAMKVPFFAASNGSWIRATPACDGETLFVAGMRDVLVALDASSGDEKWRVDFVKEFGTSLPSFGFASSPVVDGDFIYVQAGGGFVKLNKQTGDVQWRAAQDGGGMSGGAFSSPVITEFAGRKLAIVQSRLALKGIDPESGDELFSQPIDAFRGMNIITPTVYKDALYTSAHSGRSQLWRLAKNTPSAATADALNEVWSNGSQAYMSSPVIVGDHLYMHLRNQRIQCVDLNSGQEKWRSSPYGKYQSMVVVGNRILALDERGELLLFDADPAGFTLVDSRKISEDETWAHLAVCGGQIFVRELNALAVYDWQ